MRRLWLVGCVVLLSTCSPGSGNAPTPPEQNGGGSQAAGGGGGTSGAGGGTGAGGGGGGGSVQADAGRPDAGRSEPIVRFVAVGDTGEGNDAQKRVGDQIAAKCAKDGCDFVVLLGDNFYDSGVSSVSDPQWQTKFEQPYANVNLPFYAVLGNHDYGGGGLGNEFSKGQHQVDYSKQSTKWRMPAKYYKFTLGHVELIGLDTNMQMYGQDDQQKADVKSWLASSTATWKIAFGHHPYLSNGKHGNAGSYDGVPWLPIANGKGVKEFMEEVICGKADVYFAGHDHSRQWLQPTCQGTELAVSGAGAKATELPGKNPYHFQTLTLGFIWVKIDGKTLTAEFVDETGKVEYTRTFTKG